MNSLKKTFYHLFINCTWYIIILWGSVSYINFERGDIVVGLASLWGKTIKKKQKQIFQFADLPLPFFYSSSMFPLPAYTIMGWKGI